MEYDRYSHHEKIYVVGMLCLILGIIFISSALYLLPHLLLNWYYVIPTEFFSAANYLKENYGFTKSSAEMLICLVSFAIGFCFILIADFASRYIEQYELTTRKILKIKSTSKRKEKLKTDSLRTGFYVFSAILVAICLLKILEWIITTNPT